jgi:tetratricopeptide (TPR) repeat protein
MLRALLFAAVCVLPAFAGATQAADASELFAQGERAFAAADYREAVRLFTAARDAGSAGPSSYYNIGVSQFRLRDYAAAEATFAALAAEFPALRELAEYNRGLALRAAGDLRAASTAFGRARASADEKIAALADAQLRELSASPLPAVAERRLQAYVSGGVGYDDNVALVDDLLLTAGQSSSSPLNEWIGVLSREFASTPLRVDATGYLIRYADASEFDQSALRVALVAEQELGEWTFAVGPTLARSTLDGDGFEELVGADLRLRRGFDGGLAFEVRAIYDDVGAGAARFAYLDGSRRQLRLGLQHTGDARVRIGYDVERNDRADAGVSASRERWSVAYRWRLRAAWSADTALVHRKSRYSEASIPRDERLLEWSFTANRELPIGWMLSTGYRWSDNDSNVDVFSYDGRRVAVGLSRSF